jgi:DNA segregation ATPase FtsK/SpoIIIE, S-DNA-T family
MSSESFFRSRHASEILGLALFALGILTVLALFSFNPRDPNVFPWISWTVDTDAAVQSTNLIGIFGASLAATLYGLAGLAAWLAPAGLFVWGYRRFRDRPFENPGTKAAGLLLLLLSLPALLAFALGVRAVAGQPFPAGGLIGRAVADFLKTRFNAAGAVLILVVLLLASVPLLTQISLGEVFFDFRVRLIGFWSRMRLTWTRQRDQKAKDRLKKAVIAKHLEKARASEPDVVSLPDPGLHAAAPLVVEAPGKGKFSIRKVEPGGSPKRASAAATPPPPPAPAVRRQASPQQKLPLQTDPEGYQFPLPSLLDRREPRSELNARVVAEFRKLIESKCAEFGVEGEVVEVQPGPVVTTYEFRPASGVKVSQVIALAEDLALALSAESIRIERIAGRSTVGIEVPNPGGGDTIDLRDIVDSERFQGSRSLLTLALGKDIHGEPVVNDLGPMPHLLIAGTTGSGKSVGINVIISSILFKARPQDVKLILIDPKMVELASWKNLPHLFTPIVTDPRKAATALKWAVAEMDERYQKLHAVGGAKEEGVRNIDQYNAFLKDKQAVAMVKARLGDESDIELDPMPYIVIIIDELADLMITAPKEVEESIVRLAQKARAVGIHLIVATQRPSTDVLTGVIKANLPSRIAFKVSTKVDSRVILDGNGAEKLLGRGDMLFLPPGTSRLYRVHGAYVSPTEVGRLMKFLTKQAKPVFNEAITQEKEEQTRFDDSGEETDALYDEAARLVVKERMASISFLQRRMGVGFSRAGKLIDMMTRDNLLGPPRGSKPREVLVPEDYFDEVDKQPR